MLLLDVIHSLQRFGITYAITGGYAVAFHGAVRGTVDIDLVVALNEKSYVDTEKALMSIGLQSRLPVGAREVFHFRKEYIANKKMSVWPFYDPTDPSRLVDVVIAWDKERLATKNVIYDATTIAVLAKNELIQMKKQSGRPQDLEDIKALRKLL